MTEDNDEKVRSESSDQVNVLRTLELGAALKWLKDQLIDRLEGSSKTISTKGQRTKEEQEIVGMTQILSAMWPFAIELALKSLKAYLHPQSKYDHHHVLDKLFFSLTENARDTNEAQKVQDEARDSWRKRQRNGLVLFDGTLDDFLKVHSNDFVNIRYYDWSDTFDTPINDFIYCYYSILSPLIARDPDALANVLSLFGKQFDSSRRLA